MLRRRRIAPACGQRGDRGECCLFIWTYDELCPDPRAAQERRQGLSVPQKGFAGQSPLDAEGHLAYLKGALPREIQMTDHKPSADPVLAELHPSAPRRLLGVAILAALGLSMLWMVLTAPTLGFGWRIFVLLGAALSIWLAVRMWQTTGGPGLVLTRTVLRDDRGHVIARVEDMLSVDRTVFAFKPAGGFTVVTRTPGARGWAPGLWWRLGRRIGVGGITHKHEGRYMADILTDMIASRSRG